MHSRQDSAVLLATLPEHQAGILSIVACCVARHSAQELPACFSSGQPGTQQLVHQLVNGAGCIQQAA